MSAFCNTVFVLGLIAGRLTNGQNPKVYNYSPDFAPGTALNENEISIRWFGAAAYRFEYQGCVFWIDPYFSRHNIELLTGRGARPKVDQINRYMDRADYIAIGHSHYDHAADLPYIVPKTGATVIGSKSVGALFNVYGLPKEKFRLVTGGDTVEAGPFKVSFITSVHGKLLGSIPSNFDISPDENAPLPLKKYGCGEVFAILIEVGGYRIYHQGSGGLIEENIAGRRADLAIIGISSRSATPRMVYRVVKELQPKIFMPTHYDQFFTPISMGEIPVPGLKFGEVAGESKEAAPDAKIITLPLCGEYRVKVK